MNITAAQVNELRQMTGAGMMDCKKALVECNGDYEAAIDYLRKKGQKIAAKRADREAAEGCVLSKTTEDNTFAAVVMLNCETDFVGANSDFVNCTKEILDFAVANKIKDIDTLKSASLNGRPIEDHITDLSGKTGEKVQLGKYFALEAPFVTNYNHQGNRLATIVAFNKTFNGIKEIAHEVALQIAAMDPISIDENDVPADVKQREMEIGMEQARNEGKPEAMLEKIAMGKLNKFYKTNTLLHQDSLIAEGKSVKEYIQAGDKDATVTAFYRVKLC